MATTTPSTTSMLLTPQAIDDFYTFDDGQLTTCSFKLNLDVLINDLGGAAKTLWAVTTGSESDLANNEIADLTSKDVVNICELTDLGAKVAITKDGKLSYDALSLVKRLEGLGVDDTITDHITYSIRMSNGTLSVATVTVILKGTNNGVIIGPLQIGAGATTGVITEDSSGVSGGLQETTSGYITFTDADLRDTHTVTAIDKSSNYLGKFTAIVSNDSQNNTTGQVNWLFNVNNRDIQYLSAGEILQQSYAVTVDDGHGGQASQDVVVTITGTNDGPTITSGLATATGSVTEDASSLNLSTTGMITFNDIDLTDAHTTTVDGDVGNKLGGSLVMDAVSENALTEAGSVGWTYTVDNTKTQYLGAGETTSEKFTVTIDDGHGGTVTQDVVVTITGTNEINLVTVPSPDTLNQDPNNYDNLVTATTAVMNTDGSNPSSQSSLYGSTQGDLIRGTNGSDIIYGGADSDALYGDNSGDIIYGGSGNDTIYGGNSSDKLYGGSGSDSIYGDGSNDLIYGGYGADNLTGGEGSDTFIFLNVKDTGDTITNFVSGTDRIDLSAINANSASSLDTAFLWGGLTATAHGVWYADDTATHTTNIYLDTDGTVGSAEMTLKLAGDYALTTNDFLL